MEFIDKQRIHELLDGDKFDPLSTSRHCVHNLLGERELVVYGGGSGFITFSSFVLEKYGYKPTLLLDTKFAGGGLIGGFPHVRQPSTCPQKMKKTMRSLLLLLEKKHYIQ